MPSPRFFPLSAITNRIQEILQPAIGKTFWVRAELSGGRERGGSFYCDLVETKGNGEIIAQMRCNIWARDLAAIRRKFRSHELDLVLDDGILVGFLCSLGYHPKFGLSLNAVDADPSFALGEMELKKKEILKLLEKDGLFSINKQVRVPILPTTIGLITGKGSAAYSDVVKTLSLSEFGFRILFADAIMQGDKAEQSVLNAMDVLERLSVDLVLIVRGGGSKTDLYYLDNEAIARRIAGYRHPVWTAIGHEIDVSVLDWVSNHPFKTPTAAAEELVARFWEVKMRLEDSQNRLQSAWNYRLEMAERHISDATVGIRQGTRKLLDNARASLNNQANQLSMRVTGRLTRETSRIAVARRTIATSPLNILKHRSMELTNLSVRFRKERYDTRVNQETAGLADWRHRFHRAVSQRLGKEFDRVDAWQGLLKALDPSSSLKRGFSLVYGSDGALIKSVGQVATGATIKTQLADGRVTSTVDDIEKGKTDER